MTNENNEKTNYLFKILDYSIKSLRHIMELFAGVFIYKKEKYRKRNLVLTL